LKAPRQRQQAASISGAHGLISAIERQSLQQEGRDTSHQKTAQEKGKKHPFSDGHRLGRCWEKAKQWRTGVAAMPKKTGDLALKVVTLCLAG